MIKQKTLTIIDAYGFLFRAYYVLPHLSTSYGLSIGGVYGFINILLKYLTNNTDFLVVVFDTGHKNFRHAIYPQYKINRPKLPEDLIHQFPLLRETIKAFNIPYEEVEGYEADDVIATIATKYSTENIHVTIITSDKDLLQLLSNNISVYDPIKNKYLTEVYVQEKFGVPSNKLLDLLSLTGDNSDNIPGVPGIGLKTAAKLITEYSSLDNLLNNTQYIKQNKCRNTLIENKNQALLSRELLSLCKNIPLKSTVDDYILKSFDLENLTSFLTKYEFKSLVNRVNKHFQIQQYNQQENNIIENSYSAEKLAFFLEGCINKGILAIYIKDINRTITSISLAFQENTSFNIEKDNITSALKTIMPIINNTSVLKVIYNVKSFLNFFPNIRSFDDVMLMSYSADTGLHNHQISNIIYHNLQQNNSTITGQTLLILYKLLKEKLLAQQSYTIYERFEKPLIKVIYNIEKEGILVDITILKNLSDHFNKEIVLLEKAIYSLAGQDFNIGSPKQLSNILFNQMNITQTKKLKSGIYSTDAETLEELSTNGIEIASKLLKWRQLNKLKTTYTDSLQKQIDPITKRIHTTYSMTATNTGRLSSSEPNLQNIPIKSTEGNNIRRAFIAKKGYKLISADYSQIELRLLAHIANIKEFKNSFIRDEDIHIITAQQIFNTIEIDKNLRRKAKSINFGIIYGISPFGLAKQLKIPITEARRYIDYYFSCYPEIKHYMEDIKIYARKNNYVTTLFGRRCYIKDINSKNLHFRSFAERAAINAPIQGTAADIIKKAMVNLSNILKDGIMVLQIHDELLIEVLDNSASNVAMIIKETLENVVSLSTPLKVDINIGDNWADMKLL